MKALCAVLGHHMPKHGRLYGVEKREGAYLVNQLMKEGNCTRCGELLKVEWARTEIHVGD